MATYEVQTDKGTYRIETAEDSASAPPAQVANPESALGGFWKNVNPAPFLSLLKNAATSPEAAFGPPGVAANLAKQIVPGMLEAHKQEFQKAADAVSKGNHVEAFGHLLAGIVPVLGPMAGHAAETMGGTEARYDRYGNVLKPGDAPNVAGGMGEAAGLLAPAALNLAGGAVTSAAERAAPGVARGLYRGALNRGYSAGSKTPAELRALADAGVANEIPVTEAGAQKLSALMDQVQADKTALLQRATANGVTVDPNQVVRGLSDVERRFATQATPQKDLAAINEVGDEFLRSQGASKGAPPQPGKPTGLVDANGNPILSSASPGKPAQRAQPMNADQAEAVKTGTQQAVTRAEGYGEQGGGRTEALKSIAHEVKAELERQIPELAGVHEQQQTFLGLQTVLEKAVNSAAKGNPGSLKSLVTTGVTDSLVKNHPTLAVGAGLMRMVLSNPEVRSRLAIAINQAQRNNPAQWGAPSLKVSVSRVNELANALNQYTQSPLNASQATQ